MQLNRIIQTIFRRMICIKNCRDCGRNGIGRRKTDGNHAKQADGLRRQTVRKHAIRQTHNLPQQTSNRGKNGTACARGRRLRSVCGNRRNGEGADSEPCRAGSYLYRQQRVFPTEKARSADCAVGKRRQNRRRKNYSEPELLHHTNGNSG